MADLNKIVDDLSSLTVLEAAELSKLLEEKWGVSAAAPVAVAATTQAQDEKQKQAEEEAEEQAKKLLDQETGNKQNTESQANMEQLKNLAQADMDH